MVEKSLKVTEKAVTAVYKQITPKDSPLPPIDWNARFTADEQFIKAQQNNPNAKSNLFYILRDRIAAYGVEAETISSFIKTLETYGGEELKKRFKKIIFQTASIGYREHKFAEVIGWLKNYVVYERNGSSYVLADGFVPYYNNPDFLCTPLWSTWRDQTKTKNATAFCALEAGWKENESTRVGQQLFSGMEYFLEHEVAGQRHYVFEALLNKPQQAAKAEPKLETTKPAQTQEVSSKIIQLPEGEVVIPEKTLQELATMALDNKAKGTPFVTEKYIGIFIQLPSDVPWQFHSIVQANIATDINIQGGLGEVVERSWSPFKPVPGEKGLYYSLSAILPWTKPGTYVLNGASYIRKQAAVVVVEKKSAVVVLEEKSKGFRLNIPVTGEVVIPEPAQATVFKVAPLQTANDKITFQVNIINPAPTKKDALQLPNKLNMTVYLESNTKIGRVYYFQNLMAQKSEGKDSSAYTFTLPYQHFFKLKDAQLNVAFDVVTAGGKQARISFPFTLPPQATSPFDALSLQLPKYPAPFPWTILEVQSSDTDDVLVQAIASGDIYFEGFQEIGTARLDVVENKRRLKIPLLFDRQDRWWDYRNGNKKLHVAGTLSFKLPTAPAGEWQISINAFLDIPYLKGINYPDPHLRPAKEPPPQNSPIDSVSVDDFERNHSMKWKLAKSELQAGETTTLHMTIPEVPGDLDLLSFNEKSVKRMTFELQGPDNLKMYIPITKVKQTSHNEWDLQFQIPFLTPTANYSLKPLFYDYIRPTHQITSTVNGKKYRQKIMLNLEKSETPTYQIH
ncbi:MAG TPA: hypothetical protein DDW49_09695, partial [Deltaproteobacteria bacterium]|nr:hypothetical protein [Deltaproteobacteria bacterium]